MNTKRGYEKLANRSDFGIGWQSDYERKIANMSLEELGAEHNKQMLMLAKAYWKIDCIYDKYVVYYADKISERRIKKKSGKGTKEK